MKLAGPGNDDNEPLAAVSRETDLKRFKNVPQLGSQFRSLKSKLDPGIGVGYSALRHRMSGRVSSDDLSDTLVGACESDCRIAVAL